MRPLPDFRLDGRVALVTGASSGLGVRFAEVLAAAGANVALAARRRERIAALAEGIIARGGRAAAFPLDVTSAPEIARTFDAVEAALGPVDILVNNAGLNVQGRVVDLGEADYDRIMDTNLKGAFLMAQAAGSRMIARGAGGRIINIASIGATRVLPGLTVYCMSKAAIAMMTQALAREWARHNINVTAICPGYIETELNSDWFASDGGRKHIQSWPRRRLGEEEDLDGTLLLLASDASRLMTGALVTVDDGQSL